MATAKKSSKATKKSSPVKAKKTTKVARKSRKITRIQSFHLSPEEQTFLSFKFTMQSIYWLILLVLIFILAIWVLNIQITTSDLINSIQ